MKKKVDILSIISYILVGLSHILTIMLAVMMFRYAGFSKSIIFSAVCILICLLAIVDICLIFGVKLKDKVVKIIVILLATVLTLVGGVGSFALSKVNNTVNNIIENSDGEQYEVIRGVIAVYDNDKISDIKDLNNKKIGSLGTSEVNAASVGKGILEKEGINAKYEEYVMTSDLYEALFTGEIDAAIFPNVYRAQLTSTDGETTGFEEYLEKTTDFYSFEERVLTATNSSSKKDITSEPFTVLLLGYAPNQGGGGLTDSIILASINPKTFTATLTSIPRDSYAPISCYKNQRSKINEAGAASKACAMQTVSNLLKVDVDFYAEINFKGIVDVVDALDGIYIDSPIEFTGQSSDTERGDYNVWVPAGPYVANGEQALAFARERHRMPNGDFDRQIHQQEVISQIIKKLVETRDVNKLLAVMEAAGENFSTNMSLDQITKVFNYIISADQVGGIEKFSMLNIRQSRLIGYSRWYYSYSMNLPLYALYLYDGSIQENAKLSNDTMGEYDTINQEKFFKFFATDPYIRGEYYHTEFDEARVPEDIPPYYPVMTSMNYEEVLAWCNANGVNLHINALNPGDAGYIEGAEGRVIEQWPRYGALVSENPSCTITIIGQPLTEQEKVPNFVGKKYKEVKAWAAENGYTLDMEYVKNTDSAKGGFVSEQDVPAGQPKSRYTSIKVKVYEYPPLKITLVNKKSTKEQVEEFATKYLAVEPIYEIEVDTTLPEGTLISYSPEKGDANTEFTFVISTKIHDHKKAEGADPINTVEPKYEGGVTTDGYKEYKCSICGESFKEVVKFACPGHSYNEDHKCVNCGDQLEKAHAYSTEHKCTTCGKLADSLEHTYGEGNNCTICGAPKPQDSQGDQDLQNNQESQ